MEFSRRRDLWLMPHGQKLVMRMLQTEYDRAAEEMVPGGQAGFVKARGAPEQMLTMKIHNEQCMALRTPRLVGFCDMGVFFMSCVREVQWEAEKWCGVRPDVTRAVQALYEGSKGRYETAWFNGAV